jgi:hypothetical protein
MTEWPLIERIAHLIEPHEFRRWQQIYDHTIRGGATSEAAQAAANSWHGAAIERARNKAHEILVMIEDVTPAMEQAGREALNASGLPRAIWSAMLEVALEGTPPNAGKDLGASPE